MLAVKLHPVQMTKVNITLPDGHTGFSHTYFLHETPPTKPVGIVIQIIQLKKGQYYAFVSLKFISSFDHVWNN